MLLSVLFQVSFNLDNKICEITNKDILSKNSDDLGVGAIRKKICALQYAESKKNMLTIKKLIILLNIQLKEDFITNQFVLKAGNFIAICNLNHYTCSGK